MNACHSVNLIDTRNPIQSSHKVPVIALAGQPNMGKSTIFNLLTGLNQHVGNWAGKTVERRDGFFTLDGKTYNLVDLPGTYSLTANSPEEEIAREYILREKPDVVIVVVSAANLERSLYLVSEIVYLPAPVVIALNMVDVAEHEGMKVDAVGLSAALNLPVVPVIATKAVGVRELIRTAAQIISEGVPFVPNKPDIRQDVAQAILAIESLIRPYTPADYPPDWVALKLLEGDTAIHRMMEETLSVETWESVYAILRQNDDAMVALASGRYNWINSIVRSVVERPKIGQISLTERLDRYATHPLWGLIILLGVLGLVFFFTYSIGAPLQTWLDTTVIHRLAGIAGSALAAAPAWLRSLVVDGVIGGVGMVMTFLPILIIFFAAFGFLEDIGYMARAAYVMDNIMHLMGLHGKSFLPLFLGFGCNVPAIMGTRVIDSWSARILTILIAPLIPCTARMAVIAFLAPAFFGDRAFWVSWGIVLLAIFVLVILGMLLNRIVFKGERSAFIMEMPLYHIPNLRTIGLLVWQHSMAFLRKAGSIILVVSAIIWAFSYFPHGNLNSSYLAQIGKWIAPVGSWMGLDWRLTVALLSSFPAKENAIATLGVLLGSGTETGLASLMAATFSTATALSYMVVTLFFIPCLATVAVIRQETGSWKWTMVSVLLFLVISIGIGTVVYQIAVRL